MSCTVCSQIQRNHKKTELTVATIMTAIFQFSVCMWKECVPICYLCFISLYTFNQISLSNSLGSSQNLMSVWVMPMQQFYLFIFFLGGGGGGDSYFRSYDLQNFRIQSFFWTCGIIKRTANKYPGIASQFAWHVWYDCYTRYVLCGSFPS